MIFKGIVFGFIRFPRPVGSADIFPPATNYSFLTSISSKKTDKQVSLSIMGKESDIPCSERNGKQGINK
tara:strand:+ start:317 stop:523 length:207 start_codon:yes stop_codon:yes gene_type:complete